ncbi:MAG: uncharacterized protein QOF48_1205 [Verrucomicrobiota bacterium]|jgi:carbon monoxide dehydrogenase subunit G
MSSIDLNFTHYFPVPREKVFRAITNPEVLERVIDGCQKLVRTGEGTYDAELRIDVGGLKGTYAGKVALKDMNPPESYTLQIEAKSGAGSVKIEARIRLAEATDGTQLDCDAEVKVGGLLGFVGARLVEPAAKTIMDDFFRKFGEVLKTLPSNRI